MIETRFKLAKMIADELDGARFEHTVLDRNGNGRDVITIHGHYRWPTKINFSNSSQYTIGLWPTDMILDLWPQKYQNGLNCPGPDQQIHYDYTDPDDLDTLFTQVRMIQEGIQKEAGRLQSLIKQ